MAAMGEKKELKKNTSTTVFLNKKEKKTTIIPIQSFPPPSTKKKTYIKQNLSSISSHSTSVFIMREQKTFFPTFQILLNNNMQKLG
jgi:hypothetical protein